MIVFLPVTSGVRGCYRLLEPTADSGNVERIMKQPGQFTCLGSSCRDARSAAAAAEQSDPMIRS